MSRRALAHNAHIRSHPECPRLADRGPTTLHREWAHNRANYSEIRGARQNIPDRKAY